MAETYSLEAVLSARDEGFTAGMKAAGRAANSLGSKLKSGIGATKSLGETVKGAALGFAAFKVAGMAVNTLTSHLDSAIDRYDTINQFPKVMGNLGISAKKSNASIKKLSSELSGLPTTLDSAASGVTNFTSKNGDIKKSTDYFLALNNAIVAGGQSQAIQSTALEQLSQSYSKGKMDMMEWRSLQTAMPAQLKQVAKAMGMSTNELGEGLRKGNVSMDDFMGTIVKLNKKGVKGFASFSEQAKSATGGIKTAMTNLGTAVTRGIANCMGSFDKLLQDNGFPTLGEIITSTSTTIGNSFKNISKAIERINISGIVETAAPYWSAFSGAVEKVASSCGSAFGSMASSLGKFLSKQSTIDAFSTIITVFGDTITAIADTIANNSDKISEAIPYIFGLVAAYKGFKIVKSFVGPVASFTKSIASLAGKGIAALAAKLFGIAAGEKAVGKSSAASSKKILASAKSFMMLGVGVGMIAAGFGIMAGASIALAEAGPLAIGVMVAMVGALVGLGIGMTKALGSMKGSPKKFTSIAMAMLALGGAVVLISAGFWILSDAAIKLAEAGPVAIGVMFGMIVALGVLMKVAQSVGPALSASATGFLALGGAVLMISAGFYIMAQAAVSLSKGGTLAVACMLGMVVAIGVLMVLAAALGPALTAGAVGFLALGAAVLMIGAGMALASILVNSLTSFIAQLGITVSQIAMAITIAVTTIVNAIGTTLVTVIKTAGDTITQIITTIGDSFTKLTDGITKVVDAIGNGFSKVLDSVAKVIESVGTSAKNAGEGFLSVANGIKTIAGLSLGAIAKSLGAVSIGLSKISKYGSGVSQAASGLKGIVSAVNAAGAGFSSLGSKAASSMSKIKSSMNGVANSAKSAGSKIGTSFTNSMKSGLSKASGIATKASKSVATKLRSGHSAARSAGSYISQGFASGMSSCLGQIESAASRMVAAADKAIRAKAKIHSPSRMTKALGRYIAIGLGLGIRSGIKEVTSASKNLASKALTTMRNATKTRKYEDAASSAVDKYKSSMESKVSSTTKSLNKILDKGIKKLQKKNPKLKKVYTQVGKILKSDMSKTIKEQGKSAISAADKALTALGKKYQEKYDKIISDRDKYLSKLSDYGSLYSTDSYGFIALKDFTAQTKQVEALGKNMESLKKSLPYNLMSDIQDMDTASALAYTNELLKKGDSWLKKYGKDYTKFIDTSKSVSNKYYQPYITQLDKDYSKAVTSELKKLQNQMNSIGKNATAGFIKGLTSKSSKKALKKAAKDLASILTKSVKGKLKIHSPSRVLASLGKYAGQGLINGIASMKSGIADIMNQIIEIPTNPNLSFAGDVGGELSSAYDYYSNAQYTIVVPVELEGKEIAKVTAPYTEAELNKRQKREDRKRGRT